MRKKRSGHKKTDIPKATGKPAEKEPALPARLFQIFVILLILSVYGYFLAHPVNLTTGDLGRHLKNGELFIQSQSIAKTNLYSYTYPDHAFVNHHWGSGVIFYLIERMVGFHGLSLAFIAISLFTLLIFLNLATKYSSFAWAAPIAATVIPVLITRHEIRPELFSYLFSGLFLHILWGYKYRKLGFGWLFCCQSLRCFGSIYIFIFLSALSL